jgi:hypothetical protein
MVSLVIAYALNLLDYLLTAYWVNLYGTEVEANPFMRWAFENHCAWAVKIFAVGGLFGLVGYLTHRYHKCRWAGILLCGVYAILAGYHMILFVIAP